MKAFFEQPRSRGAVLCVDEVHHLLIEGLKQEGFEVLYLPHSTIPEILEIIPFAEILIIRSKLAIDETVLKLAVRLRLIARAGAGIDNVQSGNVKVINAGSANADAVGEHTVGMLLMLLNQLAKANQEVRNKVWLREENRGIELAGKTVGVIGYGNTGKAVCEKLSGFRVKLFVYDKYLNGFGGNGVVESEWDAICVQADILTFHVPLTSETKHLLNEQLIARFRKPFFLLNLSRGKVVETAALLSGLETGKIRGAALDVLENEDLERLSGEEEKRFSALCAHPQVVLSPHIGGWTHESYVKIAEVLLKRIVELNPKLKVE